MEIGINSMTVNKAYQLLKQEGYIVTDRRNGAKVREVFAEHKRLSTEAEQTLKRIISEGEDSRDDRREFLKHVGNIMRGNK